MLHQIRNPRSAVLSKLSLLKHGLESAGVIRPSNATKFVFLCGANKDKDQVSERRRALLDFSSKHLPHTQFFLAEKIFSLLQTEGHKGNLLDIEHEISIFADLIIIVLESNSSFAELGAFSHKELRDKLIVLNDKKYIDSQSFINLGPLKAIQEVKGKERIIYYDMSKDGIHRRDAIGDTFESLFEILKEPLTRKSKPLSKDECDPSLEFTKDSIMFVHDLVHFSGPILHKELVEILKYLFGHRNFKLNQHMAMLNAFGAVSRNHSGIYKSTINRPYLEYRFDVNRLIAAFRNITLKYAPERIYGY